MSWIRIQLTMIIILSLCLICLINSGCAIIGGNPKHPISIEAHLIVDVRGLSDLAAAIESYVGTTKVK